MPRVLVVEDSPTVRARLCEILETDARMEIVGTAGDGARAIELCEQLRPDVVTMDMALPVMSGLAATEYIMAHCPTPILVVSSSTNRGDLFKTYEALAAGAVDVLEKPTGDEVDGSWEARFLDTVHMVSRIRAITHPRGRLRRTQTDDDRAAQAAETVAPPAAPRGSGFDIVAIGASTGGPGALVELLGALPPSFDLPVLLVLHIGAPFSEAFADWLDGQTERRVTFATDGQLVSSVRGAVVMAPPDQHLYVSGKRLHLSSGPERHSCRPSIDVLFESVALEHGPRAVACLLTGMGRDGAGGMLQVRRQGGLTIAQDEATSVVYGMPREAVVLGGAERVMALQDIGPLLGTLGAREAHS